MKVILPFPPSANRYWRHVAGKVLISAEARTYRETAAWQASIAGFRVPFDGPVCVEITIFRPAKRGDLDNRVKVMLDALNGVAYLDDSQVVELHAYRREDKEHPRAEITVLPVEA